MDLLSGLEIRRPDVSRTGFYLDAAGHVLTTADAVATCGRVTLDDDLEARSLTTDAALGLAVLKAETPLAPIGFARFQPGLPRLQSEIAVSGYSYDGRLGAPVLTFGRLADDKGLNGEDRVSRLALNVTPGDAGGPVFDGSGAVVGLLLPPDAGPGKVLPENVSFARDAAAIAEFLSNAGLTAHAGRSGRRHLARGPDPAGPRHDRAGEPAGTDFAAGCACGDSRGALPPGPPGIFAKAKVQRPRPRSSKRPFAGEVGLARGCRPSPGRGSGGPERGARARARRRGAPDGRPWAGGPRVSRVSAASASAAIAAGRGSGSGARPCAASAGTARNQFASPCAGRDRPHRRLTSAGAQRPRGGHHQGAGGGVEIGAERGGVGEGCRARCRSGALRSASSRSRAASGGRTSASGVATSWRRTGRPSAISASTSRHHCRRISAIIGSAVTWGARATSRLKA